MYGKHGKCHICLVIYTRCFWNADLKLTIFAIYSLFSDIFATYLQGANLCKSIFSSSVMNERCIKYPSGNVFNSIEAIYQENLSSRSVFGSDFVFVFSLGRVWRGAEFRFPQDRGQSLISPYSGLTSITYLGYEQSLFLLRPWSETRETRKWPRVLAEGTRRDRREKREYTHLTKSEKKE